MIRVDNPAPSRYDLDALRALAQARFGDALLDVNELRDCGDLGAGDEVPADCPTQIAVYLPDKPNGSTAAAWTRDLARYVYTEPEQSTLVAVTVDQQALSDAQAAISRATTVEDLASAVSDALALLNPQA